MLAGAGEGDRDGVLADGDGDGFGDGVLTDGDGDGAGDGVLADVCASGVAGGGSEGDGDVDGVTARDMGGGVGNDAGARAGASGRCASCDRGSSPRDRPATSAVMPPAITIPAMPTMIGPRRRDGRDAATENAGGVARSFPPLGGGLDGPNRDEGPNREAEARGVTIAARDDRLRHCSGGSSAQACSSACAIAAALWKRAAGSFASAVRMTCSNATGRSCRSIRGDGGASSSWARIRSNNVAPANGARPVTASNNTTPVA